MYGLLGYKATLKHVHLICNSLTGHNFSWALICSVRAPFTRFLPLSAGCHDGLHITKSSPLCLSKEGKVRGIWHVFYSIHSGVGTCFSPLPLLSWVDFYGLSRHVMRGMIGQSYGSASVGNIAPVLICCLYKLGLYGTGCGTPPVV